MMTTLIIFSSNNPSKTGPFLFNCDLQETQKFIADDNKIMINNVQYTPSNSLLVGERNELMHPNGIKLFSLDNIQLITIDKNTCCVLLINKEGQISFLCNPDDTVKMNDVNKKYITINGIRYYPKYKMGEIAPAFSAPQMADSHVIEDTPQGEVVETVIDTSSDIIPIPAVDTHPDTAVDPISEPIMETVPVNNHLAKVAVATSSNLPSRYMDVNGTLCYPKYTVGIAVTTKNRHDILKTSIEEHLKHLPDDAILFIVDDGSDVPVTVPEGVFLFRFNQSQGIATAKNKCLEVLMDFGCEHLFLFDDDCYPVVDHWPQKYIDSPEPHFAHSWDLIAIWQDSRYVAYHLVGGTVLYYERKVIDDVGGMRTIFGRYGCEHVNLSDRIYNRGWTSWRYPDLVDAETLFYELDRHEKASHKSAAELADLEYNQKIGRDLWLTMLDDDEYVEYRQKENIVITVLLTSVVDNQREDYMKADVSMLAELAQSIQYGRLVVLHDNLVDPYLTTGNGLPVEFVKMENMINPYFARWLLIYQWLRDKDNINQVWAVDGTDVIQLKDPFDLKSNTLYIGQEQSSLDNDWLICKHPDERIQTFIRENKDKTLLNPGTVGGDVETVKRFAHLISKYWFDGHMEHLGNWETRCGVGDMGAAQLIAYTQFENLFYGPSVNTLFKGEQKDSFARWKHK